MKNIQQLTENTLNSLNGMKRADVSKDFGLQVWQRIQNTGQLRMPVYRMYRAAVLIGLLAGINIYTLFHYGHSSQQSTGAATSLFQSYFTPHDVQLYHIIK